MIEESSWPYPRYDEDEIDIDYEVTERDEDNEPVVARYVYKDLTKKLTCQDVEDFAKNEASLEGWDVQSSGWDEAGKVFILEVLL